jgi:hypothetical protein
VSFARSVCLGLVAGVAGTGAMTAYQLGVAKLRGQPLGTPVPDSWEEAPAPAQAAKKVVAAVGQGERVTRGQVPLLTNAMHWLYGTGWGVVYAAAFRRTGMPPLPGGLAFGAGVWGASYAELVPAGIYEPPWRYPAQELALDLSYHLVYGLALAGAYAVLER